jgi:hypothetical protein
MVYSTNLDAARRACDRRMVTFAHTAPDCAEIMWNEQNWTLISMPVASSRAQWDEGLRTVRQFNDLLRVLPPVASAATGQSVARRSGSPSRPLTPAPAGRNELAPGHAAGQPRPDVGRADPAAARPDLVRRAGPPPAQAAQRNGRQSPNYQR